MPTVSTPNLTLTETTFGGGVAVLVEVSYTATFHRFDRQLSGLGKTWHSHVTLHDYDGGDIGEEILDLATPTSREGFAVTVGTTDQRIAKTESIVVLNRSLLAVDADGVNELKAQVRLHSPETVVEFTPAVVSDQEVYTL
jgi:hypothetical protein